MISIFFNYTLFIIASIALFTTPGLFLLQFTQNKFNFKEKIILSTPIGLVFFTLIAYLLLVINYSLLLLPIFITINLVYLTKLRLRKPNFVNLFQQKLILLTLVLIIGIFGQLAIISPSGSNIGGDLVFWSANGHDGPWHIALMEEIKKGYPLQNPVYAGERLVNYHFFSDIAPAEFNRIFNFSSLDLYFKFFPFLFSLLLGLTTFILGTKIGKSFSAGIWAMFFTYFAGSFGYIVTWFQNQTIGGESLFWATQIQSSSGNPPQIAAFVILLTFLYLFITLLENRAKDWLLFIICSALVGSLIVFKVYAGVVVLGALGLVGTIQFIKERTLYILYLFFLSSIISLALYLPNTSKTVGFLIWEPWWFIRTMVVADSRLNLLDWELKRQTYLSENNLKRVLQLEITSFLIFFFGNLGMRFLGLWQMGKMFKLLINSYFYQFIIFIIVISFIFPLLFLQKGVASNTIQFMQYFLLLLGIFAGITTSQILKKIKISVFQIGLGLFIIIFAVPTQIGLIYDFYKRPPISKISLEELQALNYLKDNTTKDSIILASPYNKYLSLKGSTPPIWAWFDTSYISAFSGKHVYLADTEQVDIMGYDFKTRQKIIETLFKEDNPLLFSETFNKTSANFLYFPKIERPKVDLNLTNLKQVYSNNEIEIWQTN